MTETFSDASLVIYPDTPTWSPDNIDIIVDNLRSSELIGKAVDKQFLMQKNTFHIGEKFLDNIAFMGCSPHIQFTPTSDNTNFCYVHIVHLETPTLFHSTKQARAPHCPLCQTSEKNWQQQFNNSQTKILCNQCGTSSSIEKYNWRKSAGYARLFIEISNVFPREALPQEHFLNSLKTLQALEWKYFYFCK